MAKEEGPAVRTNTQPLVVGFKDLKNKMKALSFKRDSKACKLCGYRALWTMLTLTCASRRLKGGQGSVAMAGCLPWLH